MPVFYNDRQMVSRAGRGAIETDATRATVAVPANWETLPWPQRRAIAAQLSGAPITSAKQADAAIRAEMKRRA